MNSFACPDHTQSSSGVQSNEWLASGNSSPGLCGRVLRVNTRGEPMLNSLNLTSHLNVDNVYY